MIHISKEEKGKTRKRDGPKVCTREIALSPGQSSAVVNEPFHVCTTHQTELSHDDIEMSKIPTYFPSSGSQAAYHPKRNITQSYFLLVGSLGWLLEQQRKDIGKY